MLRGGSTAFVAPQVPVLPVVQPISQGISLAEAPAQGRTASTLERSAGIAAVVACGAGAALAGSRRRRQKQTKLKLHAVEQPDVLKGTGGPSPWDYWDPLGISKGKSDEELLRLRNCEIKHGRVSMLACLGWFHVSGGWHPIGDAAARTRVSDDPLTNLAELPIGGAFQVVFFILCMEWLTTVVCKPPEDKPWDLVGWKSVLATEENQEWKDSKLQELNNGRLAMVGIVGLISADMYTGQNPAAGMAAPCFSECPEINWLPGVY